MITIPIWLLGGCIFVILLLLVLVWAVWNNWFPPADRGSFVYTFAGDRERELAVSLFKKVLGITPRFFTVGDFARRYMYGNGVIFTIASTELTPNLGGRTTGLSVVVKDATVAAIQVRRYLEENGWKVDVYHDPDPDLAEGAMSFVVCEAFDFVLIFRKRFDKMGSMPPRWKP